MRLLSIIVMLLFFTGCGEKETQESDLKASTEDSFDKNTVLNNMGIEIHGEKITIDGNKTKLFLEELGAQIEKELNATQKELEEGNFSSEKIGVELKDEKISIDLNKTKNFLQSLIELMDSLIKE
ncbi:MAG: hypothetical protein JXQ68_01745 [Campylobacterales bacterium]|nr:hypothetical protein [Campylobacterales bacterium]